MNLVIEHAYKRAKISGDTRIHRMSDGIDLYNQGKVPLVF